MRHSRQLAAPAKGTLPQKRPHLRSALLPCSVRGEGGEKKGGLQHKRYQEARLSSMAKEFFSLTPPEALGGPIQGNPSIHSGRTNRDQWDLYHPQINQANQENTTKSLKM